MENGSDYNRETIMNCAASVNMTTCINMLTKMYLHFYYVNFR